MKLHHAVFDWSMRRVVSVVDALGRFSWFVGRTFGAALRPPWRTRLIMTQAYLLGVRGMPVAMLTALFVGMVIVLQTGYQLSAMNAKQYSAAFASKALTQVMIPIFTALVVGARTSASIAAELGTMRVTEQIDAMEVLDVAPRDYLVVPRVIATTLMLPVITIYADVVGFLGGMFIGVFSLSISVRQYWSMSIQYLSLSDVLSGLVKTFFFGAAMGICGCYFGFNARGGAEGVGQATTRAVVFTLIMLLLLEYTLSSWIIYLMDTLFTSAFKLG